MKKTLIYLDVENHKNSIDLLAVAGQIFSHVDNETFGVAVNHDCVEAHGFFDKIIKVEDTHLLERDPMIVASLLEELHNRHRFDCILIPATVFGRMLAPRLAMKLKVGLVADVTAISHHGDVLEMVRPAFSGKIMAGIVKTGDGPIMMSVRQNVFSYMEEADRQTQVLDYRPATHRTSRLKLIETREKVQTYDIRESEVLVSGGGGTARSFHKLESLADVLDGQVSASRKIIDKGIVSRSVQVGQSGKTVRPKLYMALGISGAIQHVEGLKNVENIIAVNTNRSAPICSLSDIVVEGDASEFIDKMVQRIRDGK